MERVSRQDAKEEKRGGGYGDSMLTEGAGRGDS